MNQRIEETEKLIHELASNSEMEVTVVDETGEENSFPETQSDSGIRSG